MNDDLISRQAVIEELHRYFSDEFDSGDGFNSNEYWNSTHVLQAIANVPNVEPRTGQWINIKPLLAATRCSECKRAFAEKTNYCPHCGAKMEGEAE